VTDNRKEAILAALDRFVSQRSGMDSRNYGDWQSYRSEQRRVTADLHHYRMLRAVVGANDSITADMLLEAQRAFSGRLSIKLHWDVSTSGAETLRGVKIGYCTGQYFPTEYRRAACAVLASALWDYVREHVMPAPCGKLTRTHNYIGDVEHDSIEGKTPGDWLRSHFRAQFGRSIANRYFN
jgi:hypothetical protein